MLNRLTKIHKTWNLLLSALILLLAYAYIYRELFVKEDLSRLWQDFRSDFSPNPALMLLAIVGIPLNWGIEALKWQRMIRKLEPISWARCIKAVLSGITISLFSPNRTGEFLGRIFMLEKAGRIESSIVTIATNISQLMITLLCGAIALWIYPVMNPEFSHWMNDWPDFLVYGVLPALFLLLIILYLNLHKLGKVLTRFPVFLILFPDSWRQNILERLRVLTRYTSKDWWICLIVSWLRYQVFAFQFLCIMLAFIPGFNPVEGYLLIALIFLGLTVIPGFSLADIGIRGSVSLFILGFYFSNHQLDSGSYTLAVLSISSVIWLMNILFPAILGSFGIFQMKFFRK